MTFVIPEHTTTLTDRLLAVLPPEALERLHRKYDVAQTVVYRFRSPEALRCVLVSIPPIKIQIKGIIPICVSIPNRRRKAKRKKEFYHIASINKILSKV